MVEAVSQSRPIPLVTEGPRTAVQMARRIEHWGPVLAGLAAYAREWYGLAPGKASHWAYQKANSADILNVAEVNAIISREQLGARFE